MGPSAIVYRRCCMFISITIVFIIATILVYFEQILLLIKEKNESFIFCHRLSLLGNRLMIYILWNVIRTIYKYYYFPYPYFTTKIKRDFKNRRLALNKSLCLFTYYECKSTNKWNANQTVTLTKCKDRS